MKKRYKPSKLKKTFTNFDPDIPDIFSKEQTCIQNINFKLNLNA